jgi:GT2 family glycosyltransferase
MPLPVDQAHDVLVIIPTVAVPRVLVPAFQKLCTTLDGLRVHVVLAANPKDSEAAGVALDECIRIWRSYDPAECHLTTYNHGALAGFGGAINLGLRAVLGDLSNACTVTKTSGECGVFWGVPRLTVVYNDDLVATPGWIQGLLRALDSETVCEWSELPTQDPGTKGYTRPIRRMADYGKVGLVGPASNNAAGIQGQCQATLKQIQDKGYDHFAGEWAEQNEGNVLTATFLSGFCLGITRECMEALTVYSGDGEFSWLFDERFKVAGYEDNDLCMRADLAGFRAVVAGDVFVPHIGHQTFDASFPEMRRGLANRLTYYDKWREWVQDHGRRTVAAYRVRFDVPGDLGLFRESLRRCASLVDGVAVLLTGNPAAVLDSAEFKSAGMTADSDLHLCQLCAAKPGNAHAYVYAWVSQVLYKTAGSRFSQPKVVEDVFVKASDWTAPMNERDERNVLLAMAESIKADWVLSIDHDEVLEPRLTRAHVERMMLHPDPLVQCWDLAFVNHWENPRMYRVDRPWGDGGTWTGGMRGYRFYRVNHAAPRRILAGGHAGLHCGNTPGVDLMAKRVSGVRFRHFGYMNSRDRFRKERRYNVQDPTPDPLLVGGTSYAHITRDEAMVLSAFVPENGIGLHMLMHEGESADDLGRLLDGLYAVMDRVVLVWTGKWLNGDKEWLVHPGDVNIGDPAILEDAGYWPMSGPSEAVAKMAAHFGCEWLHHPLADDLGAARNAGLDALQGTPGMGWAVFFDPDEHVPPQAPVVLRRMAEAGDCWGWMFRFRNTYQDGTANQSESVRMSRLDPDQRMRVHGRVHEGFSRAVRQLVDDGFGSVLRVCPFIVANTGLSKDPEEIQAKFDRYRRLTELQLQEDPKDPGAWVTLGLYWANEGCHDTAAECFSRGVLCADKEYLPFQELGLHLLRQARDMFAEAVERMSGHQMQAPWQAVVDFADKAAPPMKIMGTVGEFWHRAWSDGEAMKTLPGSERRTRMVDGVEYPDLTDPRD